MLNVPVRLPDTFTSIAAVSAALWQVLKFICYAEFHAASVGLHCDAAILRFVTAVPDKGLRVTGTIIITGPTYTKIASDQHRAPLPGGLPPWVA